ncbi:MAG: MBL fold metallo-hydrolase, partial [archaeon]
GHHGSRTSTSPEYAAAINPRYAIISAGKDNRYGHPHQEVLDILTKLGATILRTDELGTIIMQTDGKELRVR